MAQPSEENPYKSPAYSGTIEEKPLKDPPTDEQKIREAIYLAIGQSVVFSIFVSLILDGGIIARHWAIALIGWWIANFSILLRYKYGKSHVLTRGDIFIIKFFGWLLFILVLFVGGMLTHFL